MDFNLDAIMQFFENIKDKILSFVDTLIDFYEENKTRAYIIFGGIIVVLICLIIIILSSGKKEKEIVPEQKLELTEKLATPDGPVLPRDYNVSRKAKDKWSDDDAKDWFTTPSDKEINALSKSNDAIVNEIIGAAP